MASVFGQRHVQEIVRTRVRVGDRFSEELDVVVGVQGLCPGALSSS